MVDELDELRKFIDDNIKIGRTYIEKGRIEPVQLQEEERKLVLDNM